ncbi:TIGR03899 family protein [Motilimonas pumila]|uniref:TIGR03899 family protein n=1 Tax=Motilimonas pumila TaxID=2303987 RepID=A0A418YC05_9GAMM|nr:TIGR03899 family protein [Motilimonas pumila]RJG42055.1 TIGR03899 family protein [Motilimonas pumila]
MAPTTRIAPLNNDSGPASTQSKTVELANAYGVGARLTKEQPFNIAQRAKKRIAMEAIKKQENLEQIMLLAYQECNSDDAAGEVDPDWMTAYLRLAEEICGNNMKALWAKILAQEITSPGSFSVKSLETLKKMTQREAGVFQRCCNLSCMFSGDSGHKVITGYVRPPSSMQLFSRPDVAKLSLGKFRFPYSNILMLADLGLIYPSELESGEMQPGQELKLNCNDHMISLAANGKKLKLYYYKFTPVGNELASLIPAEMEAAYIKALTELLERNFQVASGIETSS